MSCVFVVSLPSSLMSILGLFESIPTINEPWALPSIDWLVDCRVNEQVLAIPPAALWEFFEKNKSLYAVARKMAHAKRSNRYRRFLIMQVGTNR